MRSRTRRRSVSSFVSPARGLRYLRRDGKSRILADNQSRQHVLQLRQLDLNLALARLRALRKNIEDQLRTIDYFQVRGVGNRSHLRRLQLPIENQCVSADLHGANKQFVQLPFTHHGSRIDSGASLNDFVNDCHARR